jgi:hypothetical protein
LQRIVLVSDDSSVGAASSDQDGWVAADKITGEFRKAIER